MKKLSIMFILLALLLTGCGNKNTFDYDTELENLVNTYNSGKQCFADNYEEYLLNNSSYRKLFNVVFSTCNITACSGQGNSVTCDVLIFNQEEVQKKVLNDAGFISDIKNLYDLGIAQQEIDAYVYDYLAVTITQYNKVTGKVEATLTQSTESPFQFASAGPFVTYFDTQISNLVYALEQSALNYEALATSTDASIENIATLELGDDKFLNYFYDDSYVPVKLSVKTILQGNNAKEQLVSLSDNNRQKLADNLIYIEYEVTNLSSKRIIIENKFYDADLTESVFYKDTKEFTGVSNSCYLNAGETILMKCVVVHNHDDLVWYDFKASSLIKLDYKK